MRISSQASEQAPGEPGSAKINVFPATPPNALDCKEDVPILLKLIFLNISPKPGISLFIKNLTAFKKDINSKNKKLILKKLIQTKRVRSKIIKLKQDINKPDFGRS